MDLAEAAGVTERLRLLAISLAATELLRRNFLVRNVYGSANVLFRLWSSITGAPTQRMYRTAPSGRTMRLVASKGEASTRIRLIRFAMNSRSSGWIQSSYS